MSRQQKALFPGLLYFPILLFHLGTGTSKSGNYTGVDEIRSL